MEEHNQDCGKQCACWGRGQTNGYDDAAKDNEGEIETLKAEVLSLEEEIISFKAKMDDIRGSAMY